MSTYNIKNLRLGDGANIQLGPIGNFNTESRKVYLNGELVAEGEVTITMTEDEVRIKTETGGE